MTIRTSVRFDGTRRVRGNLVRVRQAVPRYSVAPATRDLAERGAQHARRSRAYRNFRYRLRPSTGVEQVRRPSGRFSPGWAVAFGGPSAPHATYIEFGTRYIRPRRVIRNAVRYMRRIGRRVLTSGARRRFAPAVRRVVR